jgi:hypothetical protein
MFAEEKVITLRKPLVLGTGEGAVTHTELTLREPTAGEIAKAQIGAPTDTDITLNLLSLVAKIPRKAADQLCQRDLRTVAGFFGQTSDDGETEAGQS